MENERTLMQRGQTHFTELCGLVEGKPFTDIPKLVSRHNLSYGALAYKDGCDMVDVNYKSICTSLCNEDGHIFVSGETEVYDDNGKPIGSCYFD